MTSFLISMMNAEDNTISLDMAPANRDMSMMLLGF